MIENCVLNFPIVFITLARTICWEKLVDAGNASSF